MTIVTSLTENQVKEYMERVLGKTAHKLGWSVNDNDFDEPTNEILYALDEADFSFVVLQSDVKKVRTIARVEVWRAAMYYTVHEVSFSAGAPGTGQTSRADVHRHCKNMFDLAKSQFTEEYSDLSAQTSRQVERWGLGYEYDYYGNAE